MYITARIKNADFKTKVLKTPNDIRLGMMGKQFNGEFDALLFVLAPSLWLISSPRRRFPMNAAATRWWTFAWRVCDPRYNLTSWYPVVPSHGHNPLPPRAPLARPTRLTRPKSLTS